MKKEILEYKNRFYNLLESEIGDVKPIISEQTTLLNIPPMNIGIFNDASNPKQILLKGKVNGVNQTLRYNISATYGPISFDVLLKDIKRENGDLLGRVLPKAMADDKGNKKECGWSEVTCKALKLAFDKIKESDPTTISNDGYLNIKVPKDSVEAAIIQLKNKKGSSATMDAGQGVEIKLTKV